MIKEEKRDLVDRRELYRLMVNRMNEKSNGATLNSSLTLGEFMEILFDLPLYNEPRAEWVRGNAEESYICSWCRMMGNPYSRYCSYCGRHMKMEGRLESKT